MAKTAIVGTIAVNVTANTAALGAGLANANKQLSFFAWKLPSAVGSLAGLSAGFLGLYTGMRSISAAMSDLISKARNFNAHFATGTAIFENLTQDQMKRMEEQTMNVGYAFAYTGAQGMDAFRALGSAGLSAEQAIAALPLVGKFARASMIDIEESAKSLTRIQHAAGLARQDATENMVQMTRVAEGVAMANRLASGEVQDFAEMLENKAAAAALRAGISLEHLLAVGTVLANQGVIGDEAGQQLFMLLRDLTGKSIEFASVWESKGIPAWDKTTEGFEGAIPILTALTNKLNGMTPKAGRELLKDLGFTDKAIAPIQALVGKTDELIKAQKELGKTGFLDKLALGNLKDFDRAMGRLAIAWENLAKNVVGPALEWIGRKIIKITDALTSQETSMMKVAAQTTIFIISMGIVGVAISGLVIGVLGFIAVLMYLNTQLALTNILLGPIGWVVLGLAIGGAISALALFNKAWEKLSMAAAEARKEMQAAIDAAREMDEKKNSNAGKENTADAEAARQMLKFWEDLRAMAAKTTEEFMAPWEKAEVQISRLNKMLWLGPARGGIELDIYDKAVKKVMSDLYEAEEAAAGLDKAFKHQSPTGAEQGTSAAFEVIANMRNADQRAHELDAIRNRLIQETNRKLQDILNEGKKVRNQPDLKQASF